MMTPEFACTPAESTPDPSEAEAEATLLAGMIADQERAWRDFNDRYSRLIYRCITRVTARFSAVVGPDDVREIYAMLCVQLLANDKRKLRSFEPGRGNKLGSWIGMLAIHSAYDHLRTLKREPKRGALSEAEGLSSELPDPHDVCVFRQQVGMVSEILGEFSDKDREFITLYYGESLEPEEIAQRMGISVKTVYSKKHKIRSRLETLVVQRRLAA
ncbi:MAG: sigma-70 family RNA polymerase sigma factor [Polyangiaceae bacterium]|nr:sigma-70 family RNA polymerase sigma factor [Polyangiaceae bacterium]